MLNLSSFAAYECRAVEQLMVLSVLVTKEFFESHCGQAIPKPFFLFWKRMPRAAAPMSREVRSRNPANWVAPHLGTSNVVMGPPDCSAVRFAHENKGLAEIVTEENRIALVSALNRLFLDRPYREKTEAKAAEIGEKCSRMSALMRDLPTESSRTLVITFPSVVTFVLKSWIFYLG